MYNVQFLSFRYQRLYVMVKDNFYYSENGALMWHTVRDIFEHWPDGRSARLALANTESSDTPRCS